MGTILGPKYIPYSYMEPLGTYTQERQGPDEGRDGAPRNPRASALEGGNGDFSKLGVPLKGVVGIGFRVLSLGGLQKLVVPSWGSPEQGLVFWDLYWVPLFWETIKWSLGFTGFRAWRWALGSDLGLRASGLGLVLRV